MMRGKGKRKKWAICIHKQNCVWPVCDFAKVWGKGSGCCLSVRRMERCHGWEWSHQQRDKEDFLESERSLMKIRNKMGPRTLPWVILHWEGEEKKGFRWKPQYDCESGGSQSSKSGVGLGLHRQTVCRARKDARLYVQRNMSRETVLISCLTLRASAIVGRVEAACSR